MPLGPDCVSLACGQQSKPLRDLLMKLIDSKMTPTMTKACSIHFKHNGVIVCLVV